MHGNVPEGMLPTVLPGFDAARALVPRGGRKCAAAPPACDGASARLIVSWHDCRRPFRDDGRDPASCRP